MSKGKKVFFHVGLGKVASTFLQHQLFPKLQGIHYIKPSQYRRSKTIIAQIQGQDVLVSREFDQQLEEELRWFCADVSNVHVILCVRRQDDWIASQYRRRVKNGWLLEFNQFLDLKNDQGFWKKEELYYQPKTEMIQEVTGNEPLVMVYDELQEAPEAFVKRLTDYIGLTAPRISFRKVHTSFADKQLVVLQWFCRTFIRRVPKGRSNKVLHWLLYRPVWAFYHLILYGAAVIPGGWIRRRLIDPEELEEIRAFYDEDWSKVVSRSSGKKAMHQ